MSHVDYQAAYVVLTLCLGNEPQKRSFRLVGVHQRCVVLILALIPKLFKLMCVGPQTHQVEARSFIAVSIRVIISEYIG